ncbi:Slp family lipoprotein [Bowmanella yangjiangensis]|uniref:Slp family lipoprotein n=1 Tax=Bowmanella yangjiangensis TaxID=2811230 RepID=A0ABS3D038_9ALTE|nr:Slp family lipoprotein [Bowmanella yangjiangensis]MBN7821996.1 Slp family lipoprotein [Bowmanella yangjiangensis]
MKKLILAGMVLLMAGCSSLPKELQVAEGAKLLSYQDVTGNPEQSTGQQVMWGGVIADIKNQKSATLIEMVHYPIRSYGRPTSGDESVGRFRVRVNGFLDPMVYKPGRSLTVTGTVTGIEQGQVGEFEYQFPAIQASGYHLWKEIQEVEVTTLGYGFHGPYPYGWYNWHMWPYHERVIIRDKSPSRADSPQPVKPTSVPKKISR